MTKHVSWIIEIIHEKGPKLLADNVFRHSMRHSDVSAGLQSTRQRGRIVGTVWLHLPGDASRRQAGVWAVRLCACAGRLAGPSWLMSAVADMLVDHNINYRQSACGAGQFTHYVLNLLPEEHIRGVRRCCPVHLRIARHLYYSELIGLCRSLVPRGPSYPNPGHESLAMTLGAGLLLCNVTVTKCRRRRFIT